jgi:hypothetical protein
MLSLRTAVRIPQIVAHYLRQAGERARHVAEFSRPADRWSRTRVADFWDLARRGGSLAANVMGPMQSPHGLQLMSVLPPSTVYMPDFSSFQAELKNYNEVVRYALYSFVAYPTAGSLDLIFFQDSQTVGRQNTNMEQAGSLPGNQMQVVVGIRFKDIAPFADVQVTNTTPALAAGESYRLLTNNCWLEGYVSNKLYTLGAPVDFYPPGTGVGTLHTATAVAATIANFSHAQSGLAVNDAVFRQDPPLGILPTRPFNFHYRASVLNTVTTAHRVGIYLDGFQLRAVL